MLKKDFYEPALRKLIKLPAHRTANDDALVLLRLALVATAGSALTVLIVPWVLVRFIGFSLSAFVGLSVQQYTWYTGRIFKECWVEEGVPVIAVLMLSSLAIGVLSLLFSVLLPPLGRTFLLGGLHLALLTSCRWSVWGSLFDGTDKLAAKKAGNGGLAQ